jgi:hypothetical protein
LQVIGADANTHNQGLQERADQAASQGETPGSKPQTPNTKRAYEALSTVGDLQDQLM